MRTIETEPARPTVRANDSALRDWVRALEGTAPVAANPQRLLYHVIAELADVQGDASALTLAVGSESLTYRALIERANRYAHWALDQGLAKNETVCLMMPNRPEYLAIWLGLTSAGVVVALINTELRGHSLAHCIDIVSPKHVIVATECTAQFESATAQLMSRPKVWLHGDSGGFERIDRAIERCSPEPLISAERRPVTIADRALLIYTSGTTGLPKPQMSATGGCCNGVFGSPG
jgi:fatty-acyl-CoA synthase